MDYREKDKYVLKGTEACAYKMIEKAMEDFVFGPLDKDWANNYDIANAARAIIEVFSIRMNYWNAFDEEKLIKKAKAINDLTLEDKDYKAAVKKLLNARGDKKFLRVQRVGNNRYLEMNYNEIQYP